MVIRSRRGLERARGSHRLAVRIPKLLSAPPYNIEVIQIHWIAAALLFAFSLLMPVVFAAGVFRLRVLDLDIDALPQ